MTQNFALPQLMHPRQPFGPPVVPLRMIWTSSSLGLFRSCPRKWFWKYILRLRPKTKDKNLIIGGQFHVCVADWYRNKRSSMGKIVKRHIKQLKAYYEVHSGFYSQDEVDKLDVSINNFGGMMLAYEQMYDSDRQTWQIDRNLIEKQFLVKREKFDFSGKIDLVIDHRKLKDVVEHKTTSKIRSEYTSRLPLDTQSRGYMFGAREGLHIKVNNVIYDVTAKSKWRRKSNESIYDFSVRNAERYMATPSKFFYREPIPYSREAVESFEFELHQTHRRYCRMIKDMEPVLDPRQWEPNDKMCDQYFKACEFLDLCLEGLDKATGRHFEQGDTLHEELSDEEE